MLSYSLNSLASDGRVGMLDAMPAQPVVEPVTMAKMNGAEQAIVASGRETPDGGVDWLIWLERISRLAEGRSEGPVRK